MSLTYGKQLERYVIGNAATPYTLTTSYGAAGGTATLALGGLSKITLMVRYTPTNSGNSVQLRFRGSPDSPESNSGGLYQKTEAAVSGGTVTLSPSEFTFAPGGTTAVSIRIVVDVADISGEISVKETVAGGAAGTVHVRIVESGTGIE